MGAARLRTPGIPRPRVTIERERSRQVARIGNNLNQIARWANTHAEKADAFEVIAHGTGSAKAAAGQLREGVEVRRGDPDVVAAVADTLEFEQTAWAGLEPDRYAWSAVEHRERGGGVHVHVFAARCDLETGKSLNIAPPGWQQTFGPLRDAFNHEHGWSRPGTRWLWTTIEQQIEALAVLRVDIEEARTTLARIEDTTWGLELTEIEGERFVVLPEGSLSNPPWTVGGRPALKLSSE